jgi:hypothetical protein
MIVSARPTMKPFGIGRHRIAPTAVVNDVLFNCSSGSITGEQSPPNGDAGGGT